MALNDPTSILFRTKLQFIPVEELAFEKSFVRDLYATLAKPGGYAYDNVSFDDGPPTLSTARATHRGAGRSSCTVNAHSIVIEESKPEVDLYGFVEVVESVLKAINEVKDDCPPVVVLQCTIQCVARPLVCENSIELLAGRVSHLLDKINPFERPPAFFGIRFRFPPVDVVKTADGEDDDESVEERHDFVSLRYETWGQDVEQVWMEVVAQHVFQGTIELSDPGKIYDSIKDSYTFLTTKAINFINQFDTTEESDDENEETEE